MLNRISAFSAPAVFAALFLFFSSALPVRAEGLFVPMLDKHAAAMRPTPPSPGPFNPAHLPFRITSAKVDVRIDENTATTSIEQSFLNLSGRDLEVKMLYPLPSGAAINNSALSMDGQMIEGKLYNADEALRIYQSIVAQRRDPALLRYAGDCLYEASIFPVPPNQERKLKFSYTQLLTSTAGIYDYKHALSASSHYADGIGSYEFTCTIHSKNGIGPVYSSSHDVDIERRDANTATVRLKGAHFTSDNDLRLCYALDKGAAVFRVLTHRVSDNEDGYFMLIGRADDPLKGAPLPSKEIVFVVDRSGSMQGPKIQQTRSALKFCLNSLSERDRFNLITFSTDVEGLSGGDLLQATPENIKKALAGVDQIEASGGTNIDGALRAALGSNFSSTPGSTRMIVFMTDGLPTNGVTDMNEILRGIKEANREKNVRFFNFGVGDDVNTRLLDQLASDHSGTSTYVSPREDIEIKISDFFAKVKNPVLTEVAFDFGMSAGANSVYPRKIPALFKGAEFVLTGRYKGTGPGEIALTGRVGSDLKRMTLNVDWPARSLDNSYLPRVWAMRKIGYLLEQIRMNGANPEIIKEITDLSTRHGIVTPYTSQLVLEPGMTAGVTNGSGLPVNRPRSSPVEALARNFEINDKVRTDAVAAASNAYSIQSGDGATGLANWEKELQSVRNGAVNGFGISYGNGRSKAEQLAQCNSAMKMQPNDLGYKDIDKDGKLLDQLQQNAIRSVGVRTFYNRGGVWVDAQAAKQKQVVVKQYTPEYFALLKTDKEMGQVLALGNSILVCQNGTLYQIEE